MRAVVYRRPGPLDGDGALVDVTLEAPVARGRDVLVRVAAVSVNPIDTKLRRRVAPEGKHRVLGFDASGVVEAVGEAVTAFRPGDEVFSAGSIARPGTNAELHLVDERLVGKKPRALSHAEAAALPLTALTAWEMLFDRLDVRRPTAQGGGLLLVVGGAGGVGSMTLQLLRALTGLTVIATASRPETQAFARRLGAHHVVDHSRPLAPQVAALGLGPPGFVFCTTHTEQHSADLVELIAPQGRLGVIDDSPVLDAMPLKRKAVSLHWEMMFTRSLFETPDLAEQGRILNEVSALVDAGKVTSTLTEVLGPIDAKTLTLAHARLESGTTRGKLVLEGFG